jgi:hypothetical protein
MQSQTTTSWNEGQHYLIGWYLLVILLSIGVCTNLAQILVHLVKSKLWNLPNAITIFILAIQDGLFDFLCLITCLQCIALKEFPGPRNCIWQGIYAEFLMSTSGFSICLLNYSCYTNIVLGRKLSVCQFQSIQLGIFVYCLFLTLIGVIYPGNAVLNSAGLFCYTQVENLEEGIVFCIGYVLPMFGSLIWMNYKIQLKLNVMSKMLRRSSINHGETQNPRPFQVNELKSMRVYVYVMLLCYAPILSLSMYSWITGKRQPPIMWIIFGLSGHSNTLVNPVLYYILSNQARKILFDQSNHTEVENDASTSMKDFNLMLEFKQGIDIMKKIADEHFVPELTKFLFEDHVDYIQSCNATTTSTITEVDHFSCSPRSSKLLVSNTTSMLATTSISSLDQSNPSMTDLIHETEEVVVPRDIEKLFITNNQNTKYFFTKPKDDESKEGYEMKTLSENCMIVTTVEEIERKKKAKNIYDKYIITDGPWALNISDDVRNQVRRDMISNGFLDEVNVNNIEHILNSPSSCVMMLVDPKTIFQRVATVARELLFDMYLGSAEAREFVEQQRLNLNISQRGPA